MPKVDPDRERFNQEVQNHILRILESVSRREMGEALGVTRQAIHSYVSGRTTPKPDIIEKLLKKWPNKLPFRGSGFGAGAFSGPEKRLEVASSQGHLFEALNSIRPEDMKIEVASVSATDFRLSVNIKFAG
jgi:hypothetical protein